MNNFIIRTLSGFVYAGLVVGAIFAGPIYFAMLSLVFLFFTTREFYALTFIPGQKFESPLLLIIYFIVFLIPVLVLLVNLELYYLLLILSIPFLAMIYILISYSENVLSISAKLMLGMIYLPLSLAILPFLFYPSGNFSSPQIYPLLGMFIILWVNDSFAYISGSMVGRTKLFERLSPKKTWEGSLGGLLFSGLAAWLLSIFFVELSFIEWMGFALITVIFGTFGDLFESMLKRHAGVKESGKIIPGHGGLLDRLDSLLFATPMILLYLIIILNR